MSWGVERQAFADRFVPLSWRPLRLLVCIYRSRSLALIFLYLIRTITHYWHKTATVMLFRCFRTVQLVCLFGLNSCRCRLKQFQVVFLRSEIDRFRRFLIVLWRTWKIWLGHLCWFWALKVVNLEPSLWHCWIIWLSKIVMLFEIWTTMARRPTITTKFDYGAVESVSLTFLVGVKGTFVGSVFITTFIKLADIFGSMLLYHVSRAWPRCWL